MLILPLCVPVSAPTIAVAVIYCIWRRAQQALNRKDRVLRERVAYMLWVTAHQVA